MDGSISLSVSGFRDDAGDDKKSAVVTLYEISCANASTGQTWTAERRYAAFNELRLELQPFLSSDVGALRQLNSSFPPKRSLARALAEASPSDLPTGSAPLNRP